MTTSATRKPLDLAPSSPPRPRLALVLALISIPGVTIAWDFATGAGFAGVAIAIVAIVLGLQARSRLDGGKGTKVATAAVVVAGLGVLSVVFFLAVGPPGVTARTGGSGHV